MPHAYYGCFGDLGDEEASSPQGGVVLAVFRRLLAMTVRREASEVSGGRILQPDMYFRTGVVHLLCIHFGLAWAVATLRRVFEEVQRRSSESGVLCVWSAAISICWLLTRCGTPQSESCRHRGRGAWRGRGGRA